MLGHVHDGITVTVDQATDGRIPPRRSQPQYISTREPKETLHGAFAVRRLTDDHRAVMVLERPAMISDAEALVPSTSTTMGTSRYRSGDDDEYV